MGIAGPPTPAPSPVPYKKLLPLATIYFNESFVFTNIFSYVGYMVLGFKLTNDPDQVGYYAGYIGSTFSVAQFLSSFWWGKISDRFGKRPVLLLGCMGGLIANILFGFSTSLEVAIACRFLSGILNGNIGIVKGYTATICDKTNQAKAVGLLQLGLGMGGIIGPVVGSSFSKPCETFLKCSTENILYKYPYLLPNLFSSVVSLVAIIMLLTFLPNDSKIDIQLNFMKPKYSHLADNVVEMKSMDEPLVASDRSRKGSLEQVKGWWANKFSDKYLFMK